VARIFIADDDEQMREMLTVALTEAGHEVQAGGHGTSAVEAARDGTCDLILTDILMPQKEGLETITEIKSLRPDLPVVAMSGGGSMAATSYLSMARHFGADLTLKKPIKLPFLRAEITRLLAQRRAPSGLDSGTAG